MMIRLIVCLAAGALFTAPAQEASGSAKVQGSIRDARGRPAGGATIYLEWKGLSPPQSTRADASGTYRFAAVRPGTYTLRAESAAAGTATYGPFVLAERETKTIDLTLEYRFSDEPDFVVGGVTGSYSRGGHGSDAVLRSAETLARDTASLSEAPAETGAGEQSLRQAVERDPSNAAAHHALAWYEEKHGRPLEAVREYQRAAQLDASETNLFDWGAELLLHRAPEPAAAAFAKGHRLFPQSSRMLLGMAVAWYARGSYEQAARWFFEACDHNPGDARPYLFLARVQSGEIIHLPGYRERMERFATLHPDDAWANYYYAVTLWRQRNGPEDSATPVRVRELIEKALRLDPGMGVAYLQLGIVCDDQHKYSEAIAAYRKAVELSPDMEEAHYRLGQAYGRTGDQAQAARELGTYQQLSRKSAAEAERRRAEIQQFVYELRSPASPPR